MNSHTPSPAAPTRWVKSIAAFAFIFGALTLFSGGSVLFGPAEAREWAGDYVGFVVWFNFLAGGVYVVAAIGLWLGKVWATRLAATIAIATAVVALGFMVVVLQGSAFEMRTVGALAFRGTFWAVAAIIAHRTLSHA